MKQNDADYSYIHAISQNSLIFILKSLIKIDELTLWP